ncbi:MAG: lactate utilization protein C [Halioglobus sp.]
MSGSARSEIFSRLRETGRGETAENIQRERLSLGSAPAPAPPAPEMCQAFILNVLKNQGSVDCASNRSEAVRAIAHYLYAHFHSYRLVAGNDPRLAAMPWRDAGVLPRFGSLQAGEPVALSFARLGVVETGAILTWTGKANPAANNFLPEHHIVLVDKNDLVPTMENAWEKIHHAVEKTGRPRGIHFIAGPSSTADIEGDLVYGAHGPQRWHVILLGDVPGDAQNVARDASKPQS